jgi:hypothetical protein
MPSRRLVDRDLLGAVYSDRVGRRQVIVQANAAAVVWALALFPILNIGSIVDGRAPHR